MGSDRQGNSPMTIKYTRLIELLELAEILK